MKRSTEKAALADHQDSFELDPREDSSLPSSDDSTAHPTKTGGSRQGWRAYFPAAAKESGKRKGETDKQTLNLIQSFRSCLVTLSMLTVFMLAASAPAAASVITVTSTADNIAVDGVVTLREAITAANTNQPSGDALKGDPGLDTILFNIPGSGVQTIAITSFLPNITEPVIIDGYSQPGASVNTLEVGSNAVLLIELNGAGAAANVSALFLNGGNSTVRGLVINRFGGRGIYVQIKGNNTIAGNFIGTNASGTASFPVPNNVQGVYVISANNVIGGLSPADRNVISGNGTSTGGTGVTLDTAAATGNKIIGNYIGLSASGLTKIANFNSGIFLANCKSNIVGGITPAERNFISGNGKGISISGSSANNQILGNYIGPKVDGTSGAGNSDGIAINGTASGNIIGGGQPGAGNVIAFHGLPGVTVESQSINNTISGNSIFSTGSGNTNRLGIDLFAGGFGVTPNDDNAVDADSGANNLQNYPVITSVVALAGTTTIQGTIDSAASTTFKIELFSNNVCDPSGYGEGEKYLGVTNATTDASGKGSFTFAVPTASVVGGFFTSTATDPNGNTSEFSACTAGVISNPGTLQLSSSSVIGSESSGTMSVNVVRTNGSGGVVTVNYATADKLAKTPADYAGTSGTLTFQDGETIKPITVPIVDDNTPEGGESFTLTLSSPTGGAVLGAQTLAEFFVNDNELPSISISDATVQEGDQGNSKLAFMVTVSNAVNGGMVVEYATANGTATASTDYQPISGKLTFGPYETVKQLEVQVVGDTFGEPDETVFINLKNPESVTIARSQATGTIVNDDASAPAGTLAFSAATFSVNENGGQAVITIKRTGGSNGAVSVQYATVAGGTTQASDFAAASGTLDWADGEVADKTFTIAIVDDPLNEANETVNLVLTNPAGTQLGAPNTSVLTIVDNDAKPVLSISDVSQAEGNSGTTSFDFKVDLSAASGQTVTINFATADGTATASDYQLNVGTLTFNPGETSKTFAVIVKGDQDVEADETFFVGLSNPANATIGKVQGAGTIVNDDQNSPSPTIQFSQASYSTQEDPGYLTVTVTRGGDISGAASVDYQTMDGSAAQKADFEYLAGTLNFAPGEISKTLTLLINEDAYVEGVESFNVQLSNPAGAVLGQQSITLVTIMDDLAESGTNPIDESEAFVYTHYHDFLNREPDAAGLAFWTNQITACGNNAQCIEARRINVSAAFFLSIEFQETGYLRYLLEKESFGSMPKYAEFMRDVQEVSNGVIVNTPGWEQKLKDNQEQFAEKWVSRPAFKAAYDGMSNADFVNAIYTNAGILPAPAKVQTLVSALDSSNQSRAAVLLEVAADDGFRQSEHSAAFVLMQYYGYLRRDPQTAPDSDLSGYNFWLNKLNHFNGNYIDSEMVKAFITSIEYRQRFGQ